MQRGGYMKQILPQSQSCNCCGVNRRCFLATSASGFATPFAISAKVEFPTESEFKQPIDLTTFRPKPPVRIIGVVIRDKLPYWLGWPGSSFTMSRSTVENMKKRFMNLLIELV